MILRIIDALVCGSHSLMTRERIISIPVEAGSP